MCKDCVSRTKATTFWVSSMHRFFNISTKTGFRGYAECMLASSASWKSSWNRIEKTRTQHENQDCVTVFYLHKPHKVIWPQPHSVLTGKRVFKLICGLARRVAFDVGYFFTENTPKMSNLWIFWAYYWAFWACSQWRSSRRRMPHEDQGNMSLWKHVS